MVYVCFRDNLDRPRLCTIIYYLVNIFIWTVHITIRPSTEEKTLFWVSLLWVLICVLHVNTKLRKINQGICHSLYKRMLINHIYEHQANATILCLPNGLNMLINKTFCSKNIYFRNLLGKTLWSIIWVLFSMFEYEKLRSNTYI